MTDEQWAEWEAEWPAQEQARLDRMRVRGYALACANAAKKAQADLNRAEEQLARARRVAELALADAQFALEETERAFRVFSSGDADWIADVAQHLERCFG